MSHSDVPSKNVVRRTRAARNLNRPRRFSSGASESSARSTPQRPRRIPRDPIAARRRPRRQISEISEATDNDVFHDDSLATNDSSSATSLLSLTESVIMDSDSASSAASSVSSHAADESESDASNASRSASDVSTESFSSASERSRNASASPDRKSQNRSLSRSSTATALEQRRSARVARDVAELSRRSQLQRQPNAATSPPFRPGVTQRLTTTPRTSRGDSLYKRALINNARRVINVEPRKASKPPQTPSPATAPLTPVFGRLKFDNSSGSSDESEVNDGVVPGKNATAQQQTHSRRSQSTPPPSANKQTNSKEVELFNARDPPADIERRNRALRKRIVSSGDPKPWVTAMSKMRRNLSLPARTTKRTKSPSIERSQKSSRTGTKLSVESKAKLHKPTSGAKVQCQDVICAFPERFKVTTRRNVTIDPNTKKAKLTSEVLLVGSSAPFPTARIEALNKAKPTIASSEDTNDGANKVGRSAMSITVRGAEILIRRVTELREEFSLENSVTHRNLCRGYIADSRESNPQSTLSVISHFNAAKDERGDVVVKETILLQFADPNAPLRDELRAVKPRMQSRRMSFSNGQPSDKLAPQPPIAIVEGVRVGKESVEISVEHRFSSPSGNYPGLWIGTDVWGIDFMGSFRSQDDNEASVRTAVRSASEDTDLWGSDRLKDAGLREINKSANQRPQKMGTRGNGLRGRRSLSNPKNETDSDRSEFLLEQSNSSELIPHKSRKPGKLTTHSASGTSIVDHTVDLGNSTGGRPLVYEHRQPIKFGLLADGKPVAVNLRLSFKSITPLVSMTPVALKLDNVPVWCRKGFN